MNFYEVGLSSAKYHGSDPLTYKSKANIPIGTIVKVPLRSGESLGVVLATRKSSSHVKTKEIATVHEDVRVPKRQLDLLRWLCVYYPAPLSTIVRLFLPSQVAETSESEIADKKAPGLPELTKEQQQALKRLKDYAGVALLHGDTGTGKTRVYIELARRALQQNRSAIILVPEIGLVPQMLNVFESQFPGRIHHIHSGMTEKQRRETWRAIHDQKQASIVIGPRSALFMPVRDLGLVVVDEAHDSGYKQDQLPYYDATRVAAKLANLSNTMCLYGTATPRIADYWNIKEHDLPIIRLKEPINKSIKPPKFELIDNSTREAFDRSALFSENALQQIDKSIKNNEQALVFLNRRGTARFVTCQDCGWHAACPNCDTPLTYHADQHQIRCHTCGFKDGVPTSCPSCGSSELRYQRRGTKAIESELQKLFPSATIARFDSDNTKEESLGVKFKDVSSGKIEIIIGTQIVTKGLDLANLSLVVIPQSDTSTYLPDFTADEQTYQLLRQVVGRVGRTNKNTQVIIQTFHPNSPVVQAVATNDWDNFYNNQIEHRQKYNFPPFVYLMQLTTSRASPDTARRACGKLQQDLSHKFKNTEILVPSPRFHEKIQGKYQWQIIVKTKNRQNLLKIISTLPSGWRYNIDPLNLL